MRQSNGPDTPNIPTRGRPFPKGNPGRKPGARNRRTLLATALLEGETEALLRKAIEVALGGDVVMLKFLLGRLLPRERPIAIELPEMEFADDGVAALGSIMRAVSFGVISPDEGAKLATIVKSYTDAIEGGGFGQTHGCYREASHGSRAMRQTRRRQIVRLQRLVQPYLKQKEEVDQNWKQTIRGAVNHAAVMAFLIRYGKPQIDEPLSVACVRCAQSPAWRDCCDEFRSLLPGYKYLPVESPGQFEPHSIDRVSIIGERLRHVIIATYPGADEKQKLEAALASAPPWLLWFTFSDYSAKLLKLTLPDLSEVSKFMRSKANFDIWWGLPRGAFERALWPYGIEHEPLARADLNLLRPTVEDPTRPLTRRELMRRNAALQKSEREREEAWPELIPAKLLKMTFHEIFPLRPENRDFRHASIGQPRPRSTTGL